MNKKYIKLSSNMTFAYKYIITTFFFLAFIILFASIFVNILNVELPVRVILSFFAFIFCLFMIPLVKLHFIYYNDNHTVIKGVRYSKKVVNRDIVKVKRFMFYFYRLFYKEDGEIHKVIFLPNIMHTLLKFWGKPKCIKEYELSLK